MENNEAITKALIEAMEEKEITRAELARKLGISRSAVSHRFNNPGEDWGVETLEEWAEAVGCKVEIIVKDE